MAWPLWPWHRQEGALVHEPDLKAWHPSNKITRPHQSLRFSHVLTSSVCKHYIFQSMSRLNFKTKTKEQPGVPLNLQSKFHSRSLLQCMLVSLAKTFLHGIFNLDTATASVPMPLQSDPMVIDLFLLVDMTLEFRSWLTQGLHQKSWLTLTDSTIQKQSSNTG